MEVDCEDTEDDDDDVLQYSSKGVFRDVCLPWPPTVQSLSPGNDRSDVTCERDEEKTAISCNEERLLDSEEFVEPEISDVMLPLDDPVADTGLEVGDVPTSSESDDGSDSTHVPTTKRTVKPVIRLSYDEPGEPTDKSLIIVHRGVRIYIARDTEVDTNLRYNSSSNIPVHSEGRLRWKGWETPSLHREPSDGDI